MGSQADPLVAAARARDYVHMNRKLNSIRRIVSDLVAEDRSGFKRIDASAARYDDGSWLKAR
jgi:hypothetical protein